MATGSAVAVSELAGAPGGRALGRRVAFLLSIGLMAASGSVAHWGLDMWHLGKVAGTTPTESGEGYTQLVRRRDMAVVNTFCVEAAYFNLCYVAIPRSWMQAALSHEVAIVEQGLTILRATGSGHCMGPRGAHHGAQQHIVEPPVQEGRREAVAELAHRRNRKQRQTFAAKQALQSERLRLVSRRAELRDRAAERDQEWSERSVTEAEIKRLKQQLRRWRRQVAAERKRHSGHRQEEHQGAGQTLEGAGGDGGRRQGRHRERQGHTEAHYSNMAGPPGAHSHEWPSCRWWRSTSCETGREADMATAQAGRQ